MRYFLFLLMMCCTYAQACDKDAQKIYYEQDGHQYLQVTGYCRGEITYTVHLAECPCGAGLYEVKDPVLIKSVY